LGRELLVEACPGIPCLVDSPHGIRRGVLVLLALDVERRPKFGVEEIGPQPPCMWSINKKIQVRFFLDNSNA
jgi:hypothetical protein